MRAKRAIQLRKNPSAGFIVVRIERERGSVRQRYGEAIFPPTIPGSLIALVDGKVERNPEQSERSTAQPFTCPRCGARIADVTLDLARACRFWRCASCDVRGATSISDAERRQLWQERYHRTR